jgi:hypothetical protein
MRGNVNVVEKAERESDAIRGAAGNFAPAYFANKRAKNDCVEENLRGGVTRTVEERKGVGCRMRAVSMSLRERRWEREGSYLAASAALARVHNGIAHTNNCKTVSTRH